jgi:hypothetical protein
MYKKANIMAQERNPSFFLSCPSYNHTNPVQTIHSL